MAAGFSSHTLQASHALVVFDALRPWLPSDTRRRFQAGELLDNGAAFGAGRTGTSEVAEGLASFHRLYMTDRRERRVSRASGGVNTEGLRRHACGYEDQGDAPPPSGRLRHDPHVSSHGQGWKRGRSGGMSVKVN
jgi:hypothetical protein